MAIAQQSGVRITSETELFLDACPARVIGVTGTVGKSTTAAMLDAVLQASGRRAWLGGNIGHSLLADLDQIQRDDVVVLELSSFQLHWLNEITRWPAGAVVTNCSSNHLDWHGTREHYMASKQRLVSHLSPGGFVVFGAIDQELCAWRSLVPPSVDHLETWCLHQIPELRIPGTHNRTNAALAAAAAEKLGVEAETIRSSLSTFNGLPHRIEFVAEVAGRRFYNDSKSTTPAATIAALSSMDRPTWLLLGGVKQPVDYAELMATVVNHARRGGIFRSDRKEARTTGTGSRQFFLRLPRRKFERCLPLVLESLARRRRNSPLPRLRQHRPIPRLHPPG